MPARECGRSPYGVHVWVRWDEIDDMCRYCRRYYYQAAQS